MNVYLHENMIALEYQSASKFICCCVHLVLKLKLSICCTIALELYMGQLYEGGSINSESWAFSKFLNKVVVMYTTRWVPLTFIQAKKLANQKELIASEGFLPLCFSLKYLESLTKSPLKCKLRNYV